MEEMLRLRKSGKNHQGQSSHSQATLRDGLVSETFVFYLYGILLAAVGFLGEVFIQTLKRWILAVKCKILECSNSTFSCCVRLCHRTVYFISAILKNEKRSAVPLNTRSTDLRALHILA